MTQLAQWNSRRMFRFIYTSTLTVPMNKSLLDDIITVAVRNNREIGITGILLFVEGQFMQVLEGPKQHIELTTEKILSDARHTGVQILFQGGAGGRSFPDWHMKAALPTAKQISAVREIGTAEAIFDTMPAPYPPEIDFFIRGFFDGLDTKAA